MNKLLHPLYGYPLAALEFCRAVGQNLGLVKLSSVPAATHRIPAGFFGVNVAPGDDPGGDDYIVARLRELGLSRVRLHFSYESRGGPAQRLLDRLLDDNPQETRESERAHHLQLSDCSPLIRRRHGLATALSRSKRDQA